MEIYNNDCLEKLKDLSENSVDLLFCDLPYGQTSCKWDCNIDLDLFWKQINRVCKLTTPMFFTCSTKFGVSLISSNPKNFRYDLVWVKSASCGFLNAKKMPLKKHEMIYVFYRKLPFYDLSLHQHKFLPERKTIDYKNDSFIYGTIDRPDYMRKNGESSYDPPLPKSVIRTDEGCNSLYGEENKKVFIYDEKGKLRNSETRYEPPLPNSIINCKYDVNKNAYGGGKEGRIKISKNKEDHETKYDPPLPNTILEMKSEKGQHATQKPVALIEWCLKYYSKEGDVVLDPTMGSGSSGIACKNLNRKFIGIEKDTEIFNLAKKRLSL
jgi:DNA modification methylase